MHINRQVFEIIKENKKSALLLGPRQTGKSTLMAELKPDLTINLADEAVFVAFLRDPGLLRKRISGSRRIYIDEVQKIPSLLNTVQALVDENKRLQFLLTGSSARKLKRGKANLLPGRILTYNLGPLNMSELGPKFEINKLLSLGSLPGIYTEPSPELARKILRSYASTYLREEIQAEALTRNLEGFSRFFDIIASRSGDFVDFTKFSSQAMIERTSAKRYFETMVETLVLQEVPAFAKSSRRRLVQHPKYYFFDVGVLNGCLSNFNISPDRKGNLFEHLCMQMIVSEAKGRDLDFRLSVYRTDAGAEVDFILELGSKIYAIEVKATTNIGGHDLRGLKSFTDFIGKKPKNSIIIYLGTENLNIDGVEAMPLHTAIQKIFS
jgi:uncharacterized protein